MKLLVVLPVAAAVLAILVNGSKIVGWLTLRLRRDRVRLDVRLSFSTRHKQGDPDDGVRLATVKVRNAGKRPVVLTEIGITRRHQRDEPPRLTPRPGT